MFNQVQSQSSADSQDASLFMSLHNSRHDSSLVQHILHRTASLATLSAVMAQEAQPLESQLPSVPLSRPSSRGLSTSSHQLPANGRKQRLRFLLDSATLILDKQDVAFDTTPVVWDTSSTHDYRLPNTHNAIQEEADNYGNAVPEEADNYDDEDEESGEFF